MNGSATEQEGHGTAVAYRTADAVKRNEEGGGQGTTRGKEGDKERRGARKGTRNDEGARKGTRKVGETGSRQGAKRAEAVTDGGMRGEIMTDRD